MVLITLFHIFDYIRDVFDSTKIYFVKTRQDFDNAMKKFVSNLQHFYDKIIISRRILSLSGEISIMQCKIFDNIKQDFNGNTQDFCNTWQDFENTWHGLGSTLLDFDNINQFFILAENILLVSSEISLQQLKSFFFNSFQDFNSTI